ncbi:MAG: sensor histidine kinase [Oscillochloridaceae bacterium umkhey_bin13]
MVTLSPPSIQRALTHVVRLPSIQVVLSIAAIGLITALMLFLQDVIHAATAALAYEVLAWEVGAQIQVEVRDRGPGIPNELHERIFEKFVRATAAERQAVGTGLGLAICKGLVEAHGGQIWVESRPGGGAVFAFTLPITAAQITPTLTEPS